MIIFKTATDLRRHLDKLVSNGKTIGFAPTMGALHQGHLLLVAASKQQCNVSVVSIFVNPTQFNDPKDFEKYPVTIDTDCKLLEEHRVDILFLPSVEEIYPHGIIAKRHYELGELENLLEGKYRPGHFQGVCQVVERLLEIVQPHQLFLGQKDYQQCMVLQKLVALMGASITVSIAPTLREKDGLAMSSRNLRLTKDEREKATAIYQQLVMIKKKFSTEKISVLKQKASENLLQNGFHKIDYVEIASAETLLPVQENDNRSGKAVALVAAFIGDVRLIDNLLLN